MSGFPFKTALFAIALSPFILNAELREDLEDEDYVTYTDDRDDENEDGLYYDDDDLDDDLADASYSRRDSYSDQDDGDRDTGCHSPFHRMHVGVRHTEARGVGYHDGYTTLEGFGIYDHNPWFMPFLDVRGHVFNNGKLAGNIGIGERSVIPSINHMLGVYLYYDVRQENHNFTINQLSPGIELLGKRMEYRMNGYFPVSRNHSHKYGYQFNRFDGNNILLRQKQKFVMKGGDAEVGAHITQSTKYDVYAGAGPYYFSAGGAHGWGGKVRLLGRYKEYVSLEASYSYDRVFRSIVQGTVGLNYAFGKKLSRRDRNCPQKNDLMLSRAAFAPYRFEIPVVKKIRKNVKAINPATGSPWQVWFVNNTSSSAGTYQSPFPTLAQAQAASMANDMIYVFPGDGTTTGMDAGIVLKDGQKLFGSSVAHRINTTKGKIVIPSFSKTAPRITNTGNVITLANGDTVSGMNILVQTAGTTGIRGTSNINGAILDRNTISGSVDHVGIDTLGFGTFLVTNNVLSSSTMNFTGVRLGVLDGTSADLKITNNTISGYQTGISTFMSTNPTTATANIFISENFVTNFGRSGILCFAQKANAMIINNAIIDNASNFAGIEISVNLPPNAGTFLVQNNSIVTTSTNTNLSSILSEINLSTGSSAKMFFNNNNMIVGPGAGSAGLRLRTVSTDTICSTIRGNNITLQAAGTNGMNITTTGSGVINIEDFSRNIAPAINISGNVNFVAPGTCNE